MMPRCALPASVPDWCLGDTSTGEGTMYTASQQDCCRSTEDGDENFEGMQVGCSCQNWMLQELFNNVSLHLRHVL